MTLLTIPFSAGDQLVAPRVGVTHISCHYKNTIEGAGENRRINEQTRTMLGVNSEQKESMQHYISHSIYGLTLAWITSENSTKQLECRHLLTRSSFTGPYLLCYCLTAPVSGVNCPCPWFHANCLSAVPSPTASVRGSTPTACQLLSPTNSLLASRYLFRPRRDFKSKNPLSGFAPKHAKESSAWRATYIVLQHNIGLNLDQRSNQQDLDYADCITQRGVRTVPPPQKMRLFYDTKLHDEDETPIQICEMLVGWFSFMAYQPL